MSRKKEASQSLIPGLRSFSRILLIFTLVQLRIAKTIRSLKEDAPESLIVLFLVIVVIFKAFDTLYLQNTV